MVCRRSHYGLCRNHNSQVSYILWTEQFLRALYNFWTSFLEMTRSEYLSNYVCPMHQTALLSANFSLTFWLQGVSMCSVLAQSMSHKTCCWRWRVAETVSTVIAVTCSRELGNTLASSMLHSNCSHHEYFECSYHTVICIPCDILLWRLSVSCSESMLIPYLLFSKLNISICYRLIGLIFEIDLYFVLTRWLRD